ncbi:DUF3592 domain-containing protein [Bremerella sp. P1]|uniref:DUF3592 domain-containing protein n=1 Tax=Bremerella sp. P1 TaxID=3026424 RepID=UPI002368786E|nr:DUF3592 domain-containing protein [Bremerella sp. P1]WDI42171.1 hypothetical protein PSR63_27345 [Bremerella sp. P1]
MNRKTSTLRILLSEPGYPILLGFLGLWWFTVVYGNIFGEIGYRQPTEYSSTTNLKMIGIGSLLTLVWVGFFLRRVSRIKRVIAIGNQVKGRVITVDVSELKQRLVGSDPKKYDFEYEYDGRTYRNKNTIWRDDSLDDGEEVTLIIDPRNPSYALIASRYTDLEEASDDQRSDSSVKPWSGSYVGGVACAVSQLGVFWLLMLLESSFSPSELSVAYGVILSIPITIVGGFLGAFAGSLAHPITSAVAGAILSALPLLFLLGPSRAFEGDALWVVISAMCAGALGSGLGGLVGLRATRNQAKELSPASPAEKNGEESQSVNELDELESDEQSDELDRCLACGEVMQSQTKCPKCGWTYL